MVLFLANEAAAHSSGVSGHDMVIMTSTSLVVLFILGTAMVARSQAGTVPKGMAAVYEIIFDWLDGIAQGFMGREGRNYVPLSMSFFLFILMSNWAGLIPLPALVEVAHGEHVAHIPPFEAPSSSYNTTLSLAFLAFLAFNLLGLRKRLFPPLQSTIMTTNMITIMPTVRSTITIITLAESSGCGSGSATSGLLPRRC